MRSIVPRVCLGLVLFCFFLPAAQAELRDEFGIGPTTDVGPEAGNALSWVFRAREEILVVSLRSGIYKSLDGQTWTRSEHGLVTSFGIEPYARSFCQSRSTPEIAYLISLEDGISRTADFGASFEPLVLPPNAVLFDCAVDPVNASAVYALAAYMPPSGILFKSTDAGRTFSTIGAGLETVQLAFQMAVAPTNPEVVYVSDGNTPGLYVSSDGGLNFRSLPNAPASRSVFPHPTEDGTLFLVGTNGVFLSTDGGDSFERVGAGLPDQGNLVFDPTDPSVIYTALRVQGLFRSTDGGLTFERVSGLGEPELVGQGVTAVGVSPGDAQNPPVVYAATSLGPLRSDDSGATFVPAHSGFRGTQVQDMTVDGAGRLLVATINSLGLFRSIGPG